MTHMHEHMAFPSADDLLLRLNPAAYVVTQSTRGVKLWNTVLPLKLIGSAGFLNYFPYMAH